VTLRFI